MSGVADIGTLQGKVEFQDSSSAALSLLETRITSVETKFGELDTALQVTKRKADDAAGGFAGFEAQFVSLGERIIERLTIYEALRGTLDLASEAVSNAARIEDLSKAIGESTDDFQRMTYVLAEFGVDGETAGRAIETLAQRLVNGDTSAVHAVNALGLSVSDLLKAGPKELFLQVAEAAGRLEDPLTKDGIAADLFGGRLGKQLIPALSDMRQKMAEVPQDAIISDKNIDKAHEFEVGLTHLKTALEAFIVTAVAPLTDESNLKTLTDAIAGPTGDKFGSNLDVLSNAVKGLGTNAEHLADVNLPKTIGDIGAAAGPVITNAQEITNELTKLRANALSPLTKAQEDNIRSLNQWGEGQKEIAKLVGASEERVHSFIETDKAAQEAQKKFTAAMADLNSVGADYKKTLDGIDGETVDAVKYYLDAGVAQNQLAIAYGLTASQVKAVAEIRKGEIADLKLEATQLEDSSKNWATYYKLQAELSGSTTAKQAADIDAWVADEIAAHQKAKTDTADFYNFVYAQADQMAQKNVRDRELQDATSATSVKQRMKDAEDEYNFKVAHSADFTQQDILDSQKRAAQAEKEWYTWGQVSGDAAAATLKGLQQITMELESQNKALETGGTFDISPDNVDGVAKGAGVDNSALRNLLHQGYSLQESLSALQHGIQLPKKTGPPVPGFRNGGVGDFGDGTLAMLHGKEAIVPLEGGQRVGGDTHIWQISGSDPRAIAAEVQRVWMANLSMRKKLGAM